MLKSKGSILGFVTLILAIGVIGYMATNSPKDIYAPETQAQTEQPTTAVPSSETVMETAPVKTPNNMAIEQTSDALQVINDMNTMERQDITEPETVTESAPVTVATSNTPSWMEDRILGDINAPVTIIEYASLTCPHCAHFATTMLPEIKKQLIDTGKAKMIFRDFPLDQYAMKAAMIARCAPENQYYNFIEVLFHNQERWKHSKDPIAAVKRYGTLAGMTNQQMDDCLANAELENHILLGVNTAQGKYAVRSTPTFVFNDGMETLSGGTSVEDFVETVNKLSAQ